MLKKVFEGGLTRMLLPKSFLLKFRLKRVLPVVDSEIPVLLAMICLLTGMIFNF